MKKIMKSLSLLILTISVTISSVCAMTFNEAKTQDKPIVVMFHQHGCSACRRFSPRFNKMASRFSSKFNFVKEDVKYSEIEESLNFSTVPAFFIIQPKTMAAKRIDDNCAWDKECFAKALNDY